MKVIVVMLFLLLCQSLVFGDDCNGNYTLLPAREPTSNKPTKSGLLPAREPTNKDTSYKSGYGRLDEIITKIKFEESRGRSSFKDRLFKNIKINELDKKFLKEIAGKLYENGIVTKLRKETFGNYYLVIDFDKSNGNFAASLYKKFASLWGTKRVEIGLRRNIQKRRAGTSYQDRIDIGYTELESLMKGQPGLVAFHELRHQWFRYLRNLKKESIYNVQFRALRGARVHEGLSYNRYMSAEELYNFSKDISRVFIKIKDLKDKEKFALENGLFSRLVTLQEISNATIDMTTLNIAQLSSLLRDLETSKMGARRLLKKNDVFIDIDEIILTGLPGVETIVKLSSLGELKNLENSRRLLFTKINPHFLISDLLSAIPMTSVLNPYDRKGLKQLILIVKDKLESLKLVALGQKQAIDDLGVAFSYFHYNWPENEDQFIEKGTQLGRGVVEGYKGFLGNPRHLKLRDE